MPDSSSALGAREVLNDKLPAVGPRASKIFDDSACKAGYFGAKLHVRLAYYIVLEKNGEFHNLVIITESKQRLGFRQSVGRSLPVGLGAHRKHHKALVSIQPRPNVIAVLTTAPSQQWTSVSSAAAAPIAVRKACR